MNFKLLSNEKILIEILDNSVLYKLQVVLTYLEDRTVDIDIVKGNDTFSINNDNDMLEEWVNEFHVYLIKFHKNFIKPK